MIDEIMAKLRNRSLPPEEARTVWLAKDYSLADLCEDLMRISCHERHRNPDREMKGPHGTFPAWKAYTGC
jgi:hypothetical protein